MTPYQHFQKDESNRSPCEFACCGYDDADQSRSPRMSILCIR